MTTAFDPHQDALPLAIAGASTANGKPAAAPLVAPGRSGFWNKRAVKLLRRDCPGPEEAWGIYWSERKRPRRVADACRAEAPLKWALLTDRLGEATGALLDAASEGAPLAQLRKPSQAKRRRRLNSMLAEWLAAARSMPADYELALGCLAAAHLASELGGALEPTLGWRLLNALAETAQQAGVAKLPRNTPGGLIAEQCLAGELPLALAFYFPEMTPLAALERPALDRLTEAIGPVLGDEGLPPPGDLAALRPLLASWTRCRAMGKALARRPWSKEVQRHYRALVRQALRWTGPAGEPLCGGEGQWQPWGGLMDAAVRLGGSKKDAAAARCLGPATPEGSAEVAPKPGRRPLPAASFHSERSCAAVMRSGWLPGDAVVAIDYSQPEMRVEGYANGRLLLGGGWSFSAQIDGQPVEPQGSWEELCWFADKDVDYLELSLPLEGDARLERQILLAHRDRFLLLADHLQAGEPARLEHTWEIPLGPRLLFCGEGETRDALLVDGTPRARLAPLALPEWRIDPRGGELALRGSSLALSQRGQARSMACPLFVDLCEKRSGKLSTWRQLTVGESLRIQPADVAVAYRVQAGRDQWVYYRSQGPRGNRTFMGQNTSSEFLVARFKAPSGETRTLIEIEG